MGPDPRPAAGDPTNTAGDGSLADVVLVSNRGPLAFRLDAGRPAAMASGGGLAGSLFPLVEGTGATWVATSMSEADRLAAAQGIEGDVALALIALRAVPVRLPVTDEIERDPRLEHQTFSTSLPRLPPV